MRSRFASASVSVRVDAEDVLVRLLGLGRRRPARPRTCARAAGRSTVCTLGVGVSAEDVGVRVGERLPAAVDRAGEARRLLAGLLVERELLERADVDLERLRRVEELLLEELGEAVVRRQTLFLALGVRELRLVDARRASPTRPSSGRAARGSRRSRPASRPLRRGASRASSVAWCSGAAPMTSR